MPVQIDGDYVGDTPAIIDCLPRALRLVVPASAPATLFVEGARQSEVRESPVDWMHRKAREVQQAIHPEHF
jgi:hypothetical protein